MGVNLSSGRHVAALGTFAVTFGVGLAVATGTAGVAAASPQESSDTSTAASHSPQDTDTTGDDSDTSSTSDADGDGATSADTTTDADSDSDSDESDEEIATPSETTDSEGPTVSPHADTDSDDAEVEVGTPGPVGAVEPLPADAMDLSSDESGSIPDVDEGVQDPAPSDGTDLIATTSTPVEAVVTTAAPDKASTSAVTPTPPTPRAARLLQLFGVTLPQYVNESPAPPRLKIFLLGILNSIYRKYDDFYLNEAPIADPRQLISIAESGVVIGTLNAVDPDGDELRYRVEEQGEFGEAKIDANGVFLYQRAENAPLGAYTDTVIMSVDDLGLNYRDVTGLLDGTRPWLVVLVEVDPFPSAPAPPTTVFYVHNQTKDTLTLSKYQTNNFNESLYKPPAVGTQILPGEVLPFSILRSLFTRNAEGVLITSPQASFWFTFAVTPFAIPLTSCNKVTGLGQPSSCEEPFLGLGTTGVIRD